MSKLNALRCCLLAAALLGGAGAAASPPAAAPRGVPVTFGAGHGTAAEANAGLRAQMEAALAQHAARIETEMGAKFERRQAQLEMKMAAQFEEMAAQLRKEMAAKCGQAQDAHNETGAPRHEIDLAPVDATGSAAEQVL